MELEAPSKLRWSNFKDWVFLACVAGIVKMAGMTVDRFTLKADNLSTTLVEKSGEIIALKVEMADTRQALTQCQSDVKALDERVRELEIKRRR